VVQRDQSGDVVTWQQRRGRGLVFASTKDPIVEDGVQQIRHLDCYCDALTEWLGGGRPEGRFELDPRAFGVRSVH